MHIVDVVKGNILISRLPVALSVSRVPLVELYAPRDQAIDHDFIRSDKRREFRCCEQQPGGGGGGEEPHLATTVTATVIKSANERTNEGIGVGIGVGVEAQSAAAIDEQKMDERTSGGGREKKCGWTIYSEAAAWVLFRRCP